MRGLWIKLRLLSAKTNTSIFDKSIPTIREIYVRFKKNEQCYTIMNKFMTIMFLTGIVYDEAIFIGHKDISDPGC